MLAAQLRLQFFLGKVVRMLRVSGSVLVLGFIFFFFWVSFLVGFESSFSFVELLAPGNSCFPPALSTRIIINPPNLCNFKV